MSDLQYQLEVIAYWKPLLVAAEMWSSQYDALNVLCLANVIMDDPEVLKLSKLSEFRIIDDPVEAPAAVRIDYSKLFAAMGPRGRAEMGERIRSRHGK